MPILPRRKGGLPVRDYGYAAHSEGVKTVNPGSDEAIKAGCLCPRMDNSYGRGYGGGGIKDKETGETIFVRRQDCPLHGWKEEA